jgi:hypothetical protein
MMYMIYHAGTGTMINSAECLRIPMDVLAEYDDPAYAADSKDDDMAQIIDENGTRLDAAIHVVSVGNPHDGITLFGPFYTAEEAGDWAEQHIDDTWQVVTPQTGIW